MIGLFPLFNCDGGRDVSQVPDTFLQQPKQQNGGRRVFPSLSKNLGREMTQHSPFSAETSTASLSGCGIPIPLSISNMVYTYYLDVKA